MKKNSWMAWHFPLLFLTCVWICRLMKNWAWAQPYALGLCNSITHTKLLPFSTIFFRLVCVCAIKRLLRNQNKVFIKPSCFSFTILIKTTDYHTTAHNHTFLKHFVLYWFPILSLSLYINIFINPIRESIIAISSYKNVWNLLMIWEIYAACNVPND